MESCLCGPFPAKTVVLWARIFTFAGVAAFLWVAGIGLAILSPAHVPQVAHIIWVLLLAILVTIGIGITLSAAARSAMRGFHKRAAGHLRFAISLVCGLPVLIAVAVEYMMSTMASGEIALARAVAIGFGVLLSAAITVQTSGLRRRISCDTHLQMPPPP